MARNTAAMPSRARRRRQAVRAALVPAALAVACACLLLPGTLAQGGDGDDDSRHVVVCTRPLPGFDSVVLDPSTGALLRATAARFAQRGRGLNVLTPAPLFAGEPVVQFDPDDPTAPLVFDEVSREERRAPLAARALAPLRHARVPDARACGVSRRQDNRHLIEGFDVDYRELLFGELLGWTWEVHMYSGFGKAITGPRAGLCDVAMSAFTITTHREACRPDCLPVYANMTNEAITADHICCLDFAQPFMDTGSAMMLPGSLGQQDSTDAILAVLFAPNSLQTFLLVSALVVIVAHGYWWLERGSHNDQIGMDYNSGIPNAMWWAIVTATTVGYGDYSPVTRGGRYLATVWMLIGLSSTGILLGVVSSALTANALREPITSINALSGEVVCAGSLYSDTITQHSDAIPLRLSTGECFDILGGELDSSVQPLALIADAPVIEYALLHEDFAALGYVMSPFLTPVALGFSFPEKDLVPESLVSVLNPHVLHIKADAALMEELRAPWFGQAVVTTDEQPDELSVGLVVCCLLIIVGYFVARVCVRLNVSDEEKARRRAELEGKAAAGADDVEGKGAAATVGGAGVDPALQMQLTSMRRDIEKILGMMQAKGETAAP